MKKILFLAPFPTNDNVKEGMMQRVYAVDRMFENTEYEKTYIIPKYSCFKTTYKKNDRNIVEIHLSIWTSFFELIKCLKKANVVYAHSLYGITLVGFFFLPLVSKKKIVWDVHGIIPEELKLAGYSQLKVFVYSLLEKLTISRVENVIVVTDTMKSHLCRKYNCCKKNFLVYPILPMTINIANQSETIIDNKINLLYSGNMQGYQNIPLMISSIKNIVDTPNLYFYILTGQKEEMIKFFDLNGLGAKENILIESVNPNELDTYYRKAHYGFILRDNIDVNNVACPTKVVEYLAYGMTCITLNENIGDFKKMGYEYLSLDQLTKESLKSEKSKINAQIYNTLAQSNKPLKLVSFVLKL